MTQRSFEPLRTTTLVAIPLYTFFFSMGAGPVPWLLYSEVFPTRIRSRATAGKFIFIFTWAICMTSCVFLQASTLWFKVYDYDGGFDQLIGTVKIKCEDLDVHEGLAKPPPARWHTLLDASGKDKTAEGEPYGDVLIQVSLFVFPCGRLV